MNELIGFIPPLVAIVLIIVTRNALLSLSVGVIVGAATVSSHYGFSVMGQLIQKVIFDWWNVKLILGLFLLGAFIGIIELAVRDKQIVSLLINSKRRVLIQSWVIGMLLFIDDYFNILLNGIITNSFARKFHVSKEKIALIIHSLGVSACVLIPFSTWTIYITSLLRNSNVHNPLGVFIASIPFNFYSISLVFITFAVIVFEINIFGMKKKEEEAGLAEINVTGEKIDLIQILLPAFVLLGTTSILIWWYTHWTISGLLSIDLTKVLILSSLVGVSCAFWYYYKRLHLSIKSLCYASLKGMGGMSEAIGILILALILGLVVTQLNTSATISQVSSHFGKSSLYLLTFLISSGLAFVTSSWASFGIIFPMLIPLTFALGGNIAIVTAAIVSGGVFGDHSSPISSTTILTKAASKTQIMDHFHTQLPYIAIAYAISTYLFFLMGRV